MATTCRPTSQDIAGLLDQLGLGPVFLAGQDWGGSTAFALTAAHPERVRALAVLEAMRSGPWSGQDAKAGPWFAAFHRIHGLPESLVAGREDEYLAWFYDAFSASPGVPTAAAVDEYLRTYSAPGAMHAAFERYRRVPEEIRYNGQPGKTPLTLPVLAVGGEHLFGAAVAENLRAAATDVREVVLPGCSHYLSEERPDDVAQLLLDFFAGHKSGTERRDVTCGEGEASISPSASPLAPWASAAAALPATSARSSPGWHGQRRRGNDHVSSRAKYSRHASDTPDSRLGE